jgi:hypothetical protein
MICSLALVRTDISEELSSSIIIVTRIVELGTKLAVTSNRHILQRNILVPSSGTKSEPSKKPEAGRKQFLVGFLPGLFFNVKY